MRRTLCQTCSVGARDTLVDYLNRLQAAGIDAFNKWVDEQQGEIDKENDHFKTVGEPPSWIF